MGSVRVYAVRAMLYVVAWCIMVGSTYCAMVVQGTWYTLPVVLVCMVGIVGSVVCVIGAYEYRRQ